MKTAKPNPRRDAARALAAEVAAMTEAQRAEFARKAPLLTIDGHAISPFNACMIASQLSTATILGGFRQWQAAGRQVRAGEHACYFWAPGGKRKETAESEERPYFLLVPVFDISQTDAVAVTQAA